MPAPGQGASALAVTRPRDPSEFEEQAGAFLCAREAENNLVLGLVAGLKAGRTFGPEPPFFVVVREGHTVVGAAMRTPPFNLVLAAGTVPAALAPVLDRLARETAYLSGILGPKAIARPAADLWTARTGHRAHLRMAERIYVLERVVAPRPVSGGVRPPGPADVDLLARWFQAFVREAQPHLDDSIQIARANALGWIESGRLRVWQDGALVSMAGATGPTPNGIRVGAVYTPPDRRGRGYASALVAALSQEQLDAGRRFCFLFTDLANPTSNRIYQSIGYEPVCDVDEYAFSPS